VQAKKEVWLLRGVERHKTIKKHSKTEKYR